MGSQKKLYDCLMLEGCIFIGRTRNPRGINAHDGVHTVDRIKETGRLSLCIGLV